MVDGQILDHIDATLHGNSPVAFGLHPNAEIGFRTVSSGDKSTGNIASQGTPLLRVPGVSEKEGADRGEHVAVAVLTGHPRPTSTNALVRCRPRHPSPSITCLSLYALTLRPPASLWCLGPSKPSQETSDQLLAAILDLSAGDRSMGRGAVNGGVNFAEQTSQDILEVRTGPPICSTFCTSGLGRLRRSGRRRVAGAIILENILIESRNPPRNQNLSGCLDLSDSCPVFPGVGGAR